MTPIKGGPLGFSIELAGLTRTLLGLVLVGSFAATAHGAPEAHILNVDARVGPEQPRPLVTTLVDLGQSRRISELIEPCWKFQQVRQRYRCEAQILEKPFSSFSPVAFPETRALLAVRVKDQDYPAQLVDVQSWQAAQGQPRVGTAWLIALDADSRMGRGLADAKQIARTWVEKMGPEDLVNLVVFNDRQATDVSGWQSYANRAALLERISGASLFRSTTGSRALFTILKKIAADGFGRTSLTSPQPLHRAMLVLSSGFGGLDPSSTGPGGLMLSQYMTEGFFPSSQDTRQKKPLPVVALFFPEGVANSHQQNAYEFMSNLCNPSLGGFFSIVQGGEGKRAGQIHEAVTSRFSKMHLVSWRVPCLSPTIDQTLSLVFNYASLPIAGDGSFKEVDLGVDPTRWPLDVDRENTRRNAESQALAPGAELTILGEFCWGDDTKRGSALFLPASPEVTEALMPGVRDLGERTKRLVALGIRAETLRSSDRYLRVKIPNQVTLVHNENGRPLLRALVYDHRTMRTSGALPAQLIELPVTLPPQLRGNAKKGCLSDADCRIVFLHDCSQIRSCQAACPGVGTPRGFAAWQPDPPEPRCGVQPPCTPQCPAFPAAPGFGPHARCVKRQCVVVQGRPPPPEF